MSLDIDGISFERRCPPIKFKKDNIIKDVSVVDSITVLALITKMNSVSVLSSEFSESLCAIEAIMAKYLNVQLRALDVAVGSAIWDFPKEVIDHFYETCDGYKAYLIFYSLNVTEEQKVYLKMKWGFV